MSTINIKLYNTLKTEFKLSDEKAKEFTEAIQEVVDNKAERYRSDLRQDIIQLELKLISEIKDVKIDTLKWYIATSIALATIIIAVMKLI